MTTENDRRGAVEAIERIVNRGGDDVPGATIAVLRTLYPTVRLADGGFVADVQTIEDRELLARAALLVSHFTSPKTRSVFGDS